MRGQHFQYQLSKRDADLRCGWILWSKREKRVSNGDWQTKQKEIFLILAVFFTRYFYA